MAANTTPIPKERIEKDKIHPEAIKYLNKQGLYDPNKSEKIRDTYKEDRVYRHNRFNQSVFNLFDKIFTKQ